MALATAGAVASASSTYGPGYAASGVINGDRAGANWGNGGGWKDADLGQLPGVGGGGLRDQLQHQSGERVFGCRTHIGRRTSRRARRRSRRMGYAVSTCSIGRVGVDDRTGRKRDGKHAGVAHGDVHAGDDAEDSGDDDGRGRRLLPRDRDRGVCGRCGAPFSAAAHDRRHRAIPRAVHVGADVGPCRARPAGRFRRLPHGAVRRADVELSVAPGGAHDARQRHVPERLLVSARQLHALPAAKPVLPQWTLRPGSTAAARRLRAAPDHRRVRRRHLLAVLVRAVPSDSRPSGVRQLSRPAV